MYINSMYCLKKSLKKITYNKKKRKNSKSKKSAKSKTLRKPIFRLNCRTNKFKKYLVY